ncbi:hypothetical protein JCM11491_004700 [Sporobolomyces phaffii]
MGAPHWRPLEDGVEFTAQTASRGMQSVVANRDATFRQQRERVNQSLQQRARAAVDLAARNDSSFANAVGRYFDFCESLAVPPFPISTTLIALCVYAKTSHHDGHYLSLVRYLRRARALTNDLSIAAGVVDTGSIGDSAEVATTEFLHERTHVRVRERVKPPRIAKSVSLTYGFLDSGTVRSREEISSSSSSSADSDSDDEDDDDDETSDGQGDSSEDEAVTAQGSPRRATTSVSQVPSSSLPRDGQQFDTPEEFLIACYVPLILTYGNGAHLWGQNTTPTVWCARHHLQYAKTPQGLCSWKMVGTYDEHDRRIKVRYSQSFFVHSHGPRAELLRDPEWRPTVKNVEARRLLGMDGSGSGRSKPAQVTSSEQVHRNEVAASTSHAARPDSNESFKRPRLSGPGPSAIASRPTSSTSAPLATTTLLPLPSRSTPSSDVTSTGVPPPFTLAHVAAFLAGVHPSLATLAPDLYAAGFDSSDAVAALVAFDAATLDRVCRAVQQQQQQPNAVAERKPVSVVHVKLLQKKLTEARTGGYT